MKDATYYRKDIERNRARSRANAARDSEKRKLYFKAYYRAHAEEMKQRAMAYVKTPAGRMVRRAVMSKRKAAQRGADVIHSVDAAAVFAAWGGRCAYCTQPATELDHFLPIARGGRHDLTNIVPACRGCNATKQARDPWLFLATAVQ